MYFVLCIAMLSVSESFPQNKNILLLLPSPTSFSQTTGHQVIVSPFCLAILPPTHLYDLQPLYSADTTFFLSKLA